MDNQKIKDEIKKISHGECFDVGESDYGKAEIWRLNNIYVLFEIPMYGGEPFFSNTFPCNDDGVDAMLKEINSMT